MEYIGENFSQSPYILNLRIEKYRVYKHPGGIRIENDAI